MSGGFGRSRAGAGLPDDHPLRRGGVDPELARIVEQVVRELVQKDPTALFDPRSFPETAVRPSATQGDSLITTDRGAVWMQAPLVGGIMAFAGATPPNGWLLCYGQAVSRTVYARLFAIIGTAHGSGDGVTTFNVPDLRGRVPVGIDDMGGVDAGRLTSWSNVLGASGGAQTNVHTHAIASDARAAVGVINGNIGWLAALASNAWQNTTVSFYSHAPGSVGGTYGFNHHAPVYGNTNTPSDTNVMQPSMNLNYVIWTGANP